MFIISFCTKDCLDKLKYLTASNLYRIMEKLEAYLVLNRDKEKELAKAAKERFIQLVTANPSGLCVIECGNFDKYGRILVTVYNGINKESINELMIKEGHGKPYEGGTKDAW